MEEPVMRIITARQWYISRTTLKCLLRAEVCVNLAVHVHEAKLSISERKDTEFGQTIGRNCETTWYRLCHLGAVVWVLDLLSCSWMCLKSRDKAAVSSNHT